MQSGIYLIACVISGKAYIGSTQNIQARWSNHLSLLRRGKHHSIHLQRAWDKYGDANFSFIILELAPVSALLEREQAWMDSISPAYNIARVAGRQTGVKLSEETRQKMSAARIGKTPSDETRAKMAAWQIGRTRTEETRRRMSQSKRDSGSGKGRPAWNKGKMHSEETRQKMRLARKAYLNRRNSA